MTIAITAEAYGHSKLPDTAHNQNYDPRLGFFPDSISNGDFVIVAGPSFHAPDEDGRPALIGDGQNEETRWAFNFRRDPNFSAFLGSTLPLTSAKLSLTLLAPKHDAAANDSVRIDPLYNFSVDAAVGPQNPGTILSDVFYNHYWGATDGKASDITDFELCAPGGWGRVPAGGWANLAAPGGYHLSEDAQGHVTLPADPNMTPLPATPGTAVGTSYLGTMSQAGGYNPDDVLAIFNGHLPDGDRAGQVPDYGAEGTIAPGCVPMVYSDHAIVVYAKLVLTRDTAPSSCWQRFIHWTAEKAYNYWWSVETHGGFVPDNPSIRPQGR